MANDLVVKPQANLQQASAAWGLAGSGHGDLKIRCEIGQPMSQGKETGKFNFSTDEWKPQEKLTNVVVVYPARTRVLYGKGLKVKRRCGSDNWVLPSPTIENPINTKCLECPLSKWDSELSPDELAFKRKMETETDKKQMLAPLCKDTIQLVVVDDRMVPYSLRFQKASLAVVTQKLINRIKYKGKLPYQVAFDLSLKMGDPNKGKFYEYVFENVRDLTLDEVGPYEEMFKYYQANGETLMADHINNMDSEKDITPREPGDEIPF
jgi:hypothetical protein